MKSTTKIVIVAGHSKVGKTMLCYSLAGEIPPPSPPPTIGIDFKICKVNDEKLLIYEIVNEHRFSGSIVQYVIRANVLIVMYSVLSIDTVKTAESIMANMPDKKRKFLVGNLFGSDTETDRCAHCAATILAEDYGMIHIVVDTKTGKGVHSLRASIEGVFQADELNQKKELQKSCIIT